MEIISNKVAQVNTVEAEFKADAAELEEQLQAAFLKKKAKFQVPGFRKGKASRKMIENQYGENIFYEDAVNNLYPKMVDWVVKQLELEVVDIKDIEVVSLDKKDGIVVKACFITEPEINISGYRGLKVPVESNTVTDSDISAKLEGLRKKGARIIDAGERKTKTTDTITFDFEGFCDGVPFDGGSAENFTLEIGSRRFIPGFEEQLVDRALGDEFDVNVTFPADYNPEELASKDAVFKCRINGIKETQLPELDDEFVKDISEFNTIDELKEDLKTQIAEEKEQARKIAIDNTLANLLSTMVEGDIPEVMFERKIDDLINDWAYQNLRKELSLEDYLKHSGVTIEKFREMFSQSAEGRVKLQLALKKIASLEGLDITDSVLDEEFVKLAELHKMPLEEVRKVISPGTFKKDLLNDRAFDIVREAAEIEIQT
ncbi:MAG: trigger factor [Oscillospiraceae bacterium]|nr:trigger factor [Oscillospiraceae bacterium]